MQVQTNLNLTGTVPTDGNRLDQPLLFSGLRIGQLHPDDLPRRGGDPGYVPALLGRPVLYRDGREGGVPLGQVLIGLEVVLPGARGSLLETVYLCRNAITSLLNSFAEIEKSL